jgi:hypothetical protein
MTWRWELGSDGLDIWDHNDDVVESGRDIGQTYRGEYPDEILTVMGESARDALATNDLLYAVETVMDGAFESIEEGPP